MNDMITVFTPTYNREKLLIRLYSSLCKQKYKNFEWIIVDDGSTDQTENKVKKFLTENKIKKIRYFKQQNSGKHVAFNMAIEKSKGELFICVDSDDYLTDDALDNIIQYYNKYKMTKKICGLVFQKGYSINQRINKKYKDLEFIENYNNYIINNEFKGDKCEVFITNILKKYRFPVFKNEKFLSEGFLYSKIGREYNYVFIDKIIYLCEYQETGLTKSGRKLRINNPLGGMEHAKEYLDKNIYKTKIILKNYLLYYTYFRFYKNKNKEIYNKIEVNKNILSLIGYCFSYILYLYWNKKYMNNRS